MFRFLEKDKIKFYDKIIEEDQRAAGYNLGDLLNIPSLMNLFNQCPHNDDYGLERMNLLGKYYVNSILYLYCQNRSNNNEIIPNIPLLINTVDNFTDTYGNDYKEIIELVKNDNMCCIHIRNGDSETEQDYIDIIEKYFAH
jgi:hypothetical protein